MGVRILEGREGESVFYCSSTEWAFGPLMPSQEVAEAFLRSFGRPNDPRLLTDVQLEKAWNEFRVRLSCPFGHFEKADVTNFRDGRSVFTCMEKGCKSVWDRDGNVLDEEEEEDDDLTEAERLGEARA